MVSEKRNSTPLRKPQWVLILVLVEDGLGVFELLIGWEIRDIVLILVLVEDGLGVLAAALKALSARVLILVLVEDGLGES